MLACIILFNFVFRYFFTDSIDIAVSITQPVSYDVMYLIVKSGFVTAEETPQVSI